jgi:hypothetical protein
VTVLVPPLVWKDICYMRDHGVDMTDADNVIGACVANCRDQAAAWLREHRHEYAEGLHAGFNVDDPPKEGNAL